MLALAPTAPFSLISNVPKKKRVIKIPGLGLQLDALGWTIVVLIIAAIVLLAIFQLREASRVASTKMEMGEIENAVMQYEGLRSDGKSLDSLSTLLNTTAIPAGSAIDGVAHGSFLPSNNSRWSSGTIVDMWGTAYGYNYSSTTNTHTITSTGSGKTLTVTF